MRTIGPDRDCTIPEHCNRWSWVFVPGYLLLHGIIATCLPDRFDPLSTFFIVAAELIAIGACVKVFLRADPGIRVFWLLLASAIFLHSMAMSLEAAAEFTHTPILNHVGGVQILLSLLYGLPLLVAVSIQNDPKVLPAARIIHAILSIAVGAVIYIEIFSFLTLHGSANSSDAVLLTNLFDVMDVFLAIAGTIRWLGSSQGDERRFFRVVTIFLYANTVLPAIHNRILIRHDYVWLDLLISAPYVVLVPLLLTSRNRLSSPPSPALVRIIRSGSPLFLAGVLALVGAIAAHAHVYIGIAATLSAIVGYGTFNMFVQSRGIEAEESLLASNAALEKLVALDSLTGIANRRAFDSTLRRECALTRRTHQPVSLLMIDVDMFKKLNDAKGHLTGDEYLIRIAAALRGALPRCTDFIARFGGEEFSVILPATDRAGAMIIAEKLREQIAQLRLSHPVASSGIMTVSIGVSSFDGSVPCSPSDLIQSADGGLYVAKEVGRNCCIYHELKASRAHARLDVTP